MPNEPLKPCPWENVPGYHLPQIEILGDIGDRAVQVFCTCGASGPLKMTKREAIAAWNQRAEKEEADRAQLPTHD